MTIEITCPTCGSRFEVSETAEGRKARCGKCRSSFVVARQIETEQATEPDYIFPPDFFAPPDSNSPPLPNQLAEFFDGLQKAPRCDSEQIDAVDNEDFDRKKRCPFCAEEILARAIKCKHCGEMLGAPVIAQRRDTVLLSAKGYNGQVQLFPDRIRIERKGFLGWLSHGTDGQKDILLTKITGIQLKKPGFTVGYFQVVFSGSHESKRGVFDGVHDENTVTFQSEATTRFEQLRDKV